MSEPASLGGNHRGLLRSLPSPLFVISALLLAAAAVGLRPSLTALEEHYRKRPIAPRRPFAEFTAAHLPSFRESKDLPIFGGSFEAMETDEFLMLTLRERDEQRLRGRAFLFATYYSDPEDNVPHTPEVCYRQGDTIVEKLTTTSLDLPGITPPGRPLEARLLLMKEPAVYVAIVYLFCVNGDFVYDREQVRWRILMPGDRHIYFSKIEAVAEYKHPEEAPLAIARAGRLMGEGLPVLIREYFPDTNEVTGR